MDINITTAPDCTLLASIHGASFIHPWDENAFGEIFSVGGTYAFIAPGSGFAVMRMLGHDAEIITLAVLPEKRRQENGRALTRAMITTAREKGVESLFLEVRERNSAAIGLYESLGFATISRRRKYYANPDGTCEDALVMKKGL